MSDIRIKRKPLGLLWEAGDPIYVANNARIAWVHLEWLCKANLTFRELFWQMTSTYRFERVSAKEVERTNLVTLDRETISDVPNANGEAMDVNLYLNYKNPLNPSAKSRAEIPGLIFGTPGAEIFYGHQKPVTTGVTDPLWDEIESRTQRSRNEDLLKKFPFTPEAGFDLIIQTDDCTTKEANELMLPETKTETDGSITTVKARINKIDFENSLGLSAEQIADVKDDGITTDMRELTVHTLTNIKESKV